jgi:predicted enzyme related to lactoylglutathione lyase
MTTRDTDWPAGTPCWVDVAVDDVEKARAFYSSLLGWEIETGDPEFGGYASCRKDGRTVAGLSPKMSPDDPSAWTTYLATDDVRATSAKVVEAGGQVVVEPMAVGDLGTMALAVDPGGAFVGFWQGAKHTGFQLANEPGSVTWNENLSRAWTQNQGFYTALFGWEYDDMSGPDFEYATFKVDGHIAGGIGQLGPGMPTEVPPHWSTYFKVADTDAAVADVERLGGTAIRQAWDTPFGRMAAVTDDQGVQFMVMADVRG